MFPSLFLVRLEDNGLLIATKEARSWGEVSNVLNAYTGPLSSVVNQVKGGIKVFNPSGIILTDDWAPIEQITYKAVRG